MDMSASANDVLVWVSGSGLVIAGAVFLFGVVLRLFEIFLLGRTPDLAAPREATPGSGLRTLWRRSLPPQGMLRRSPVTYVGGYVFHVGFLVVVILALPHIATVHHLAGIDQRECNETGASRLKSSEIIRLRPWRCWREKFHDRSTKVHSDRLDFYSTPDAPPSRLMLVPVT
jgi:hypothetical protein